MSLYTRDLVELGPCFRHLALQSPLGPPFHLDASYLGHLGGRPRLAGRWSSYLPFHGHPGPWDCSLEPAFIRKRNERERHRVRCVNEGYARLREHLPRDLDEKRLSKVETLRAAIDYIKHLQGVLGPGGGSHAVEVEVSLVVGDARRTGCGSDGESKNSLSDGGETVY